MSRIKNLWHLRRWRRLGIGTHAVIEWNGKPIRSVKKSFAKERAEKSRCTSMRPICPHFSGSG